MKISYTLKDFNKGKIISKYGLEDGGNAHLFFSNSCFRRMQKYVPFKTGALSTTVTVKPTSVTYEVPYAHKQYTTNKGVGIRGRYWDRKMVANEKDQLAKETENYIKKLKGND